MLQIKNLNKKYKNNDKYSVKNLNLTVASGEIFGFLGKNGAGKSTTIKCLTGIIPFETGEILIDGRDIKKEPIAAKMNIGYVPDDHAVYDNLTGREYVSFMANVYGVDKETAKKRMDKFERGFSMSKFMDKQIRSYSHGMKQKICIMGALIHNPHLWVLDEPFTGLDPQGIDEIKEYMFMHKKQGNTVFFSTHNIDMAAKLCDRIGIMHNGQLLDVVEVKKFISSGQSLEEHFMKLTKN